MARRELGPAALEVAQAVAGLWPGGDVVLGVSGGPDSLALALGAKWCAERYSGVARAVIVDHQLQEGSGDLAAHFSETLSVRGIPAEVRTIDVPRSPDGLEASARDARLAALARDGMPVMLGHTLDDQAEQVFLGLIRGSGARSLAGIAARSSYDVDGTSTPLLRPLLGVRKSTVEQACREWDIDYWNDPMNTDPAYMRVRVRDWLAAFEAGVGRDLVPALSRSAALARADADLLDELAREAVDVATDALPVDAVESLPDALRWRVLKSWLGRAGGVVAMRHVWAVDELLTGWRGQGPIDVPGARVVRCEGELRLVG